MRLLVAVVVALLAVLAAVVWKTVLSNGSTAAECSTFLYENETYNTCDAFSKDYASARRRFREAAEAAGCELTTLPVYKGDCTMDICVKKGDLPGLIVHVSGTHGIEGFAGSAIQIAFLNSAPKQLPTIIFVHSFNPFGMANYRRVNEHNVDLNRNGLSESEWSDFAKNHWNTDDYNKFRSLLKPESANVWYLIFTVVWNAVTSISQHGLPKLKKALVGAQYVDESGVFYGGKETEQSYVILANFLKDYLSSRQNSVDDVTFIDVHTGLGKSGSDTLLMSDYMDTTCEVDTHFQAPHYKTKEATSVSQGYENVLGTTMHYFGRMLPNNSCLLTQEFGTVPVPVAGIALVVENAIFHKLPKPERLQWSKATVKRAFYPDSEVWRQSVLTHGLRLMHQAIRRTAEKTKHQQSSPAELGETVAADERKGET